MTRAILLIILVYAKICFSQEEKTPVHITQSDKFEIIGELGHELGKLVTIEAKILDGPFKGYDGGPNALVLSINDSAIQNIIKIPITPFFGSFGEGGLPVVKINDVYRFRVYETGQYLGDPHTAKLEAKIIRQSTGFHFRNELVVISGEKIQEKNPSPDMFIGRIALLSGIAENMNDTAYITGIDWKLKLTESRSWGAQEIGKRAEVYGLIHNSIEPNIYLATKYEARLIELKDLVNQQVTLRGIAKSMNGKWWFQYRHEDIYVENMSKMPNWSAENHFQSIEISGILKSIKDESINNVDYHSYCGCEYVILNPEWKIITELLIPEISIE